MQNPCQNVLEKKDKPIGKLLRAVRRGVRDPEVIRQLIQAGADDPNEIDSDGWTALHHVVNARTVTSWDQQILQLLISAGASPDIPDKDGQTPLLLIAKKFADYNYCRCCLAQNLIAAGVDVNKVDSSGATSLHYAARYGKSDLVRILLSAGASPDSVVVDKDYTPLLALMAFGELVKHEQRFNVAQQLIAAGANVNAEVRDRNPSPSLPPRSSLILACTCGDKKTTNLLLSHGASITSLTRFGRRSITLATMSNSVKLVQKLIDAGFDVNLVWRKEDPSTGKLGSLQTTLRIAIENYNVDMLKFLLKRGADPNGANKLGKSALFVAVRKYSSRLKVLPILKLLLSYGADVHDGGFRNPKSPFELLMSKNRTGEVQLLLDHGLDLSRYDPQTPDAFSPLHQAVSSSEMLALLLDYKYQGLLNLEHVNVDGLTPLCVAALRGYKDSVEYLLESGANVEHVDLKGRTPLELAVSCSRRVFKPEILELMVRAGAKIQSVLAELVPASQMRTLDWVYGRNGRESNDSDDSDEDALDFYCEDDMEESEYCLLKVKYIVRSRILYESYSSPIADGEPIKLESMGESPKLRRYFERCKSEIMELKKSTFYGSINYHDLLITEKNVYKRVRDDRVYEAFNEEDLRIRFPIFNKDLLKSFRIAKRMHTIWEKAVDKLGEYLEYDQDTYYLLIHNILKRLRPCDLISLAES